MIPEFLRWLTGRPHPMPIHPGLYNYIATGVTKMPRRKKCKKQKNL